MTERIAERIGTIERQLSGLQAEVLAAHSRVAGTANTHQVRLAKVTGTVSAGQNIYSITFLDGKFIETAGQQTINWEDRQSQSRTVACSFGESQPQSGAIVMCVSQNNRWWIMPTGSGGGGTWQSETKIGMSSEWIEHDRYGYIELEQTSNETFEEQGRSVSGDAVLAYNPIEKIQNESKCIVTRATLYGANPETQWVVTHSFSATRCVGVLWEDLAGGQGGALREPKGINGHLSEGVIAWLPSASMNLVANTTVWAELRWDPIIRLSWWWIYSADCGPAT